MSSSNGTEYYLKSMNGIKSFDDGSGTVIEDDSITIATIECTGNTNTKSITAVSMECTGDITCDDNITASSITTATIGNSVSEMSITSDIYSTKQIRIPKILCNNFQGLGTGGVGNDIIIGNDNTQTSAVYIGKEEQTILGTVYPAIPPKTKCIPTSNFDICNKLYVDNATSGTNILSLSNTFTGATNTFNNTIECNTIQKEPNTTLEDVYLYDTLQTNNKIRIATAGTTVNYINIGSIYSGILLCNCFAVENLKISAQSATNNFEMFSPTTGTITFNKFKFLGQTIEPAVPATGTSFLTTSTATINIGGNGSINIGGTGKLRLGDSILIQGKALDSILATDTINAFSTLNTGTLNLCNGLTSGILNIGTSLGSSGTIKMCSNLIFKNGSIASSAVNNTISLFNNITTGTVNMCSNLVFQQNAIRSSGSSDAIDLFKNINGGSINIGNLLTTGSVNISNTTSSGTVNMCNSLIFKIRSIASSAVGDTISLFNNLTT